jgi:hypothetical protein
VLAGTFKYFLPVFDISVKNKTTIPGTGTGTLFKPSIGI